MCMIINVCHMVADIYKPPGLIQILRSYCNIIIIYYIVPFSGQQIRDFTILKIGFGLHKTFFLSFAIKYINFKLVIFKPGFVAYKGVYSADICFYVLFMYPQSLLLKRKHFREVSHH